MANRRDALNFLNEIHAHAPKKLFHQIDHSQQGIRFVLAYLAKSGGTVTAGDIAKGLHVSTARISALLNKMEKQGLITRRTSSEDARRTEVFLTPEGALSEETNREQILEKMELLLERVGEEDLRTFIRIFCEIKKALEE